MKIPVISKEQWFLIISMGICFMILAFTKNENWAIAGLVALFCLVTTLDE
jgi:4-hydroxybenzoate polyprenyltransferase